LIKVPAQKNPWGLDSRAASVEASAHSVSRSASHLREPAHRARAHPKYIQAQLGHASIQTTLDRYGHLMPDMHEAEARKLDRLVFGPGAGTDAAQRGPIGVNNVKGASGNDR